MQSWLRKILGLHWLLLVLTYGLLGFGIYAIYSATWMREESFWTSQIVWGLIGTPLFFAVAMVDYRWIRFGAWPLYLVGVLGLVAVMLVGERRFGARSWLDLGVMSVQPSQVAILAGIMTLAVFLEMTKGWPDFWRIVVAGLITGVPWVLILMEPDLGSCIVWVPVLMGMLFLGGLGKRWLIVMILIGVAMVPLVVYFGLRDYQYRRITTFLNPNLDPQGDGWNINQSLLAIGSGGFYGKGFKAPNTLNELGFLPKTIVHNDFIFSVLGEQHGFVGGAGLVAAMLLLMVCGLHVAMCARDDLGRLLACGVVMLLFTHTFMNIGMTISLTPITGLPLPLISYGGSFLIITMVSLGILQSVWIHRRGW